MSNIFVERSNIGDYIHTIFSKEAIIKALQTVSKNGEHEMLSDLISETIDDLMPDFKPHTSRLERVVLYYAILQRRGGIGATVYLALDFSQKSREILTNKRTFFTERDFNFFKSKTEMNTKSLIKEKELKDILKIYIEQAVIYTALSE